MNKVNISVIVPIYKIEPYLSQCIDSILDQSFTAFELILVDNGSPDNCPQICDEYADKDNRIKVIHKEHGSLLSGRKEGLKNAKGKYIAYIDGDDWVDKFYLDILYNLAEVNNSDLVVTGHFREFEGKIETVKPSYAGVFDENEIKNSILPKAMYNGGFCEHEISTYVWSKLFKREMLNKVLFEVPDEIVMGEDAAITYTYLTISKKLTISRIPLYYYRQRNDSILKTIKNSSIEYSRLGMLKDFLEIKLSPYLDAENLNTQILYYLYSSILVRSGGLIHDASGNVIFNPFLNTKKNSKVIVYSSGSFGQHLMSANSKSDYFQIVKWIDIDYHEMNIGHNFVEPMSAIVNTEFDFLIIATINPVVFKSIKAELMLMGIDSKKIVQINTDEKEIYQLLQQLGFTKHLIEH
ncbi:glycosyltransferase family 2 protein [Tamlana sp. s12]|uniref:glycosyltransferase family 2 protein n=1 Tax=Tamlana sp. s12 TaxID=1630406 RepID=UPI0007FEB349|nr:glycosyltransferase family 2 protein [Tamlana sp. s12]OBQ54244.1 glycosyl transferase [Tamlana sp. s12]QQY81373.1 glycosyltransferase family 2 protein [Tamlana sp. s12]